jgi:hypothetical protein
VRSIKTVVIRPIHIIHRNAGQRQQFAKSLSHGKVEGFSMTSKPKEAAIDQIVASCNGDIRGALKALLLVNEQLEAELQQIYATVAHGERGDSVLH